MTHLFKNTIVNYSRLIFSILVTFFTTRVILRELGQVDYGIFNLLGGVVAMLSFINGAMAAATQRYLSVQQGKRDFKELKVLFSHSQIIHFSLALVLFLLLEIVNQCFLIEVINIPEDKISQAHIVMHCLSVSTFFSIVSAPYLALINSHEQIIVISIISFVESLLKVVIALIIMLIDNIDKLVLYSFLTALLICLSSITYVIYSRINYDECKTIFSYKKKLILELSSFAGWNLFGALCSVARIQGLSLVLNIFFGAGINSAFGISNQLTTQLNYFSTSLLQVFNPKIMKNEGENNKDGMIKLALIASKYSFFFLSLLILPMIFEVQTILKTWLKELPPYTAEFTTLLLIANLISQLTIGIQSGLQATGKIKYYQIIVGSLLLLNLPLAWLILKLGYPPYFVLYSFICIETIACLFRIYLFQLYTRFTYEQFIHSILNKILIPLIVVLLTGIFISNVFDFHYRFILTYLVCSIFYVISFYLVGTEESERVAIKNVLVKISF